MARREELIKTLGELRFTEYEAKTYLALLELSPLSAYAVSRQSGVPRSKIYEVLEGMVGRGEVLASYGHPTKYAPLPPRELIALRRRSMESTLAAAEEGLESLAMSASKEAHIWDVSGRDEILERVREVIGRARWRVLLHLWAEDAPQVQASLAAAAERGAEVIIIAYGDLDLPSATIYRHEMTAEFNHGDGGRWIILSVDQQEIVAGIVSLDEASRAAWSSHPALVVPITEQAKHDLYIMEMLARHREILEASFGPGLIKLREHFGPTTIVAQRQLIQDQP